MYRFYIIICLSLLSCLASFADERPTKRERDSWMQEMLDYKVDYIAKDLGLNEEEKAKFAGVYTSMEKELRTVQKETQKLEKDVRKKGDKATKLEMEKAAEAQFELRGKENQIELKYFPKLKAVLSPAQLLKLKESERKFMRHVMNQHSKSKKKK